MVRATGMAAGGLILLTVLAEPGGAAEQQFSCKGSVVRGETPATPQKTLDLNWALSDKNKLSMKTGDGKMLGPSITSNNKIQLKFATKEFVGE